MLAPFLNLNVTVKPFISATSKLAASLSLYSSACSCTLPDHRD
jgi:hypothetical protein